MQQIHKINDQAQITIAFKKEKFQVEEQRTAQLQANDTERTLTVQLQGQGNKLLRIIAIIRPGR